MINCDIRFATQLDVDAICALEYEYGHEVYSKELILSDIESSQSLTLVAVIDGTVIGYLSAMLVVDECELLKIIVGERYRKCGIGKKLIDSLKKYCQDKNIENIYLEVRSDNLMAKGFYVNNGFEHIGKRKGYYNGIDADLYRLSLNEKSKL